MPPVQRDHHVITTPEALDQLVEDYLHHDAFAFDVETLPGPRGAPRTDVRRNTVAWISLSTYGRADVIPIRHPHGELIRIDYPLTASGKARQALWESQGKTFKARKAEISADVRKADHVWSPAPEQLDPDQVFGALKRLMFSDLTKVGHNLKFDLSSVEKYLGDFPSPPYADTMVAAYLVDSGHFPRQGYPRPYALDAVTHREVGYEMEKGVGKEIEAHGFSVVARYSWLDSRYTWLAWRRLDRKLRAAKLGKLFALEMDVLGVLTHMEKHGAHIDPAALAELDQILAHKVGLARQAVEDLAPKGFNVDSTPQKQKLLFDPKPNGRGLTPKEFTKTGAPSTAASALESYRNRDKLVGAMLDYADLAKLHGTYVQAYARTTVERRGSKELYPLVVGGRIHADFNQIGAATGRLSCVAADTLVDMPRDLVKQPDGVPITDVRVGDLVYAFDWKRDLVLRRVRWVAQTGVRSTMVITVRDSAGNERILRATPEHLIRLWNGDWRPAGSLMHRWGDPTRRDGPRLLTMVRRTVEDGYVRIYPHSVSRSGGTTGGGRNREHRFVMAAVRGRRVSTKADVHHVDGNRCNNAVDNLEVLPVAEHRGSRHLHEGWGQRAGLHSEPSLYVGPNDFRVVSVEPGPVEPVWDMEVEDAHTFIANGICVHNCREPNLQNVPSSGTENGKAIRSLFVAPEGHVLVVADYSQIEPRVIASFSGDETMVRAYRNGEDIYTAIATPLGLDRKAGKTLVLALGYGIGADSVADRLDVGIRKAQKIMSDFDDRFSSIARYKAQVIKEARSKRPPHVTTLFGRRRFLPALWSSNGGHKAAAERQAFNTKIQGSAADLIKVAMVRAHRALPEGCHLILSVHDELVTVAPTHLAEQASEAIRAAMEDIEIPGFLVPLVADIKVVTRWANAKD